MNDPESVIWFRFKECLFSVEKFNYIYQVQPSRSIRKVVLLRIHSLTTSRTFILICLDDLYAITKYNNDLAWIIMSSRNTGNHGLPMKFSVIVQFMIVMINFLCHCSDKLRSKAAHFKPEKISSQVTFLKSRLIIVCRILQIVSHSITFYQMPNYQMQLENLFHFTKCDPFYQMCSILPNVFHFTKCVPF